MEKLLWNWTSATAVVKCWFVAKAGESNWNYGDKPNLQEQALVEAARAPATKEIL